MKFELNIYGKEDEVIKKYQTNHISWGTFMKSIELNEQIKSATYAEQFNAINQFIMTIFDGLTETELKKADGFDVINTFKQITASAGTINGGSKN